jgi:hypothetical protein
MFVKQMAFQITKRGRGLERVVQNKYLHSKTLSQVKSNAYDSPFWKGVLKVKDDFLVMDVSK